MPAWKGAVAKGFTPDAFDAYVRQLTFGLWRPEFVVLHNTSVPRLADWHKVSGPARMRGFVGYYRDEQHWSAGPHLFVADDSIWVFTPLTTSGIHAPSWNAVSWGVEMVGDYNAEELGEAVLGNTIAALATLHDVGELDPSSLRLHKEDPLTTHKGCPGGRVQKEDVIGRVQSALQHQFAGDHLVDRLAPG
jgi:hypothetical protein